MSATSPTPEETREGQTFSGTTRLSTYASFVKLPHTVFALPFALVGVIIASYQHPVTWAMLGWVVLAFTAARFAAMGFNRIIDREYDARNPQEAWWVALNNIDPERDTRFTMGPMDVLDHSSRAFTYGSKMGIDATRKLPEEGFTREWPPVIEMDAATKQAVDAMWPSLGIPAR